jgi:hypothetical protein
MIQAKKVATNKVQQRRRGRAQTLRAAAPRTSELCGDAALHCISFVDQSFIQLLTQSVTLSGVVVVRDVQELRAN